MANDLLEKIKVTEEAISEKEKRSMELQEAHQKSEEKFNSQIKENQANIAILRERKCRLGREQYSDEFRRGALVDFGLNSDNAELTDFSLIVKESNYNISDYKTIDALFRLEIALRKKETHDVNSSREAIKDSCEAKEQPPENRDNASLKMESNKQQEELHSMAFPDAANDQLPRKKVFISHSSKDISAVKHIVDLLELIGFDESNLFCSSIEPYGIPTDVEIYEYLKTQFREFDLHVIFVLSNNYYSSPACLNEMGAAWVLSCKQTAMLLPEFNFSNLEGAINPRKIAIQFKAGMAANELYNLKSRISSFIDDMGKIANKKSSIREERRDEFIDIMNSYTDGTSTK